MRQNFSHHGYFFPELADKAHVLQDDGDPLTAVLGLVDIARGTNSFYKLQALEGDTKMRFVHNFMLSQVSKKCGLF